MPTSSPSSDSPLNLVAEGVRQKLIRFEDEKKYVVYVDQAKRRRYDQPEEKVQVETYLKLLLRYKYPAERVRCFVPVAMGSDKREADIIVYADDKRQAPLIVVECKAADISELEFLRATEQASSYAVAEGARDLADTADLAAAQALIAAAKTPEAVRAAKQHFANVADGQREHTFKLARELEAATGLESRVSILGYVQRGGTPCAADRLLGSRLGTAAAHAVGKGQFGVMVAARGDDTALVPLDEVAGQLKLVPPDHEWVSTARKLGTGLGD